MLGTKKREEAPEAAPIRSRGPIIAGVAVAAIVILAVVFAIVANGDDPEAGAASSSTVASTTAASDATTTTALSGPALEGAAGVVGVKADTIDGPGTEPDRIVFNEDGTFAVTDQSRIVDTGVYTTNGDEITFESDATAHEPTDDVRWFYDPALGVNNNACEGVVGSYTLTWQTSTRFVLNVVTDACPRRLSMANRLELEVLTG